MTANPYTLQAQAAECTEELTLSVITAELSGTPKEEILKQIAITGVRNEDAERTYQAIVRRLPPDACRAKSTAKRSEGGNSLSTPVPNGIERIAVASLVFGMIALLGTPVLLPPFVFGIPAVALGRGARNNAQISSAGYNMAVAGTVCGVAALCLVAALLVAVSLNLLPT